MTAISPDRLLLCALSPLPAKLRLPSILLDSTGLPLLVGPVLPKIADADRSTSSSFDVLVAADFDALVDSDSVTLRMSPMRKALLSSNRRTERPA